MKKATAIICLFLDIGGVLLANGWDHHTRKRSDLTLRQIGEALDGPKYTTMPSYVRHGGLT